MKESRKFDFLKYFCAFDERVCLSCMFWSGYRKKEKDKISTISPGTQGLCLWQKNIPMRADGSCTNWLQKFNK